MSAPQSVFERPLELATCATADALPAAAGAAPEWVHLLPLGAVNGRDGRKFWLTDPAGLVAEFKARQADLPVAYEHQTDTPPKGHTGPIPVAGWIKDLRIAANGLWGRVDWTDRARAMIGAREYRFLSPVILHDGTGHILGLKGAGLVHTPNLKLKALSAQEAPTMSDMPPNAPADPSAPRNLAAMLAKVAALLGLPPDADPAEIEAALLVALSSPPDPKKFVPVAAVQDMLRDRNARLATLSEEAAGAKVDDAVRRGYITPGLKHWALALCRQDPDSFDGFLSGAVPAFAHLTKPVLPVAFPERQSIARGTPEEIAICAQLGLPPGSLRT